MLVLISSFWSCSDLFGPDDDLSHFSAITETDEKGLFIGTIDQRDWSPVSYENVYFGQGYWLTPYKYISLRADSIYLNDSQTIRLYNAALHPIDFTTATEAPFSCTPLHFQIPAAVLSSCTLKIILPQLSDSLYRDSLRISSSTGDKLGLPIEGRLRTEDDWLIFMPPLRDTQINPAFPNPAIGQTRIRFVLRNDSRVKIYTVNKDGDKVKSLAEGRFNGGYHMIEWDVHSLDDGLYRVFFQAAGVETYGDVEVQH